MTIPLRHLAVPFAVALALTLASAPTRGSQQEGLPAGHPTVASPPVSDVIPPVPAGAGSGAAALAWTAPATWISQPAANPMRRAQYKVPGPGGEGECVVFYFGPGQGGAPIDNAKRWASQFTDAAGQPATGTMKTRTEQVNGVPVLFVEASGAYQTGSSMGSGMAVARPDWALLGAVAEGADANWFFKLTGPKATLDAERGAFEGMLRSVKRGG